MQGIDAMDNEREADDGVEGPEYEGKDEVGSEIVYKKVGECGDGEVEDGGGAQKDGFVGGVEGDGPGQ